MEKQTMGTFIAALRRASGMTQREMAERLNVSDKAVSRWERDESAPDLSLLPLIADLFDITIDELVRGRRNAESGRTEAPARGDSARSDERARRSVQTIAGKELSRFRNRSLISAGIGTAGIVVALLCNFCFTAAKLGFFLSLLFYGTAAILETVFVRNYFTSIGSRMIYPDLLSDGATLDACLPPYREWGARSALTLYAWTIGLLGATLPMAYAPAYTGIFVNWAQIMGSILLGLVFAAATLLIYRFAIRTSLVRKGILSERAEPTERDFARRKVVKRYALNLAILLAVTGIGAAIFNCLDVTVYAKAKVFDDFDSFVEYMEQPMGEDGDAIITEAPAVTMEVYSVPIIPDDAENLSEDDEWWKDTITDAEGNVLCRYLWCNQSVVSVRPSGDGLPIYVYTHSAMRDAYNLQENVNIAFWILAALEVAICGILCYQKWKKV